jgi:Fe-S-cluster containining protein
MKSEKNEKEEKALELLKHPLLPLVNLVEFLYFTGPLKKIGEVLDSMAKSVELEGVTYEKPGQDLKQYLEILQEFEVVKGEKKLSVSLPFIVDEKQVPVAKRQALGFLIRQEILSRELEIINSLLCGPFGCVLCCTGPNSEFDELSGFKGRMKQEFFEIPLEEREAELFSLQKIDTDESRALTAQADPALQYDSKPFYKHEMALYHWQNGWSLILPEGSTCPQLTRETKRCAIYEKRAEVCRKPQIFAYVLEKTADTAKRSDGVLIPVYMARNMVLAVWDCPYVRRYQDEIGGYAEISGLEPIFKKSKL